MAVGIRNSQEGDKSKTHCRDIFRTLAMIRKIRSRFGEKFSLGHVELQAKVGNLGRDA